MAKNYTVAKYTANNGIVLDVIKTDGSNIMIDNLAGAKDLKQSGYTGINGGFFSWKTRSILSLAKCDGTVYSATNNWLGAGAIYYNSKAMRYITGERQLTADDIPGTNRTGTWAQGGYSMWLGAKDAFDRAMDEVGRSDGGYLTGYSDSGRTALVADVIHQQVFLIVTNSGNTYSTFRTAIEEYLDIPVKRYPDGQYKGIMLDGGGSSQLCAGGRSIAAGDGRELYEVIVLRDDT